MNCVRVGLGFARAVGAAKDACVAWSYWADGVASVAWIVWVAGVVWNA